MVKYERWKNALEGKGLRMNVDKSIVSKVDPSGACGERVGCNSIHCKICHRRCSDVPRQ